MPSLYQGPTHFALASGDSDFRDRRFLRFSEREVGFESDFHLLEQSLRHLLPQQQSDGCFMPPEVLARPDKSDDHLGVAGMLAYYLTLVPPQPKWENALRCGIQYQLDHLSWKARNQSGRYVRYLISEDSTFDWCNTLWVLQSVNHLLKYARPFISNAQFSEVEQLGADLWDYLSQFSQRDENPCHNQLLEYAALGYSYGKAAGRADVQRSVMEYYHSTLRRLRVKDRGRWIYTEFNRWCAHYALLSWSALEHLWSESGDPTCEKDALEMAAAFNDRLSAGGYAFGGSRRDEAGYEEFLYPLWLREKQFGFDRLLLPEPSDRWSGLLFDGHTGRCMVGRMPLYALGRPEEPLRPTESPFVLRNDRCSLYLTAHGLPHQISVNGLEILEANTPLKNGGGIIWKSGGHWKADEAIANPPPSSKLHHYHEVKIADFSNLSVRTTMQRGIYWELRQWWVSNGSTLGWFTHLVSHNTFDTDEIKWVWGNPYLSEMDGDVRPIREIRDSKGFAATQGKEQFLRGSNLLRVGNQLFTSTHPIQFTRPDENAFDGFPTRNGQSWASQKDSNRLEIVLSEGAHRIQARENLFAAAQISGNPLLPEVNSSPEFWECRLSLGTFRASEKNGLWSYTFQDLQGIHKLDSPAFRIHFPTKSLHF